MTIGETIRKAIKEVSDGLLGLMTPKDIRLTDDEVSDYLKYGMMTKEKPTKEYVGVNPFVIAEVPVKPKRARTKKGTYKGDDKSTKDVNEAWVGGKAPKKKRKK